MPRTVDELDKNGRTMTRYLDQKMTTKALDLPSEDVDISARFPRYGARGQHKFGICNRNLTGKAVIVEKAGHSVERSMRIRIPLSDEVLNS